MLARSSWLAALSLLGLSVAGCRKPEPRPADDIQQAGGELVPAAPADLQQMLAALGDRGVCVLVLRDAQWRASVGALLERLGQLDHKGSSIEQSWGSPVASLRWLAEQMELPVRAGELQGRDDSRPIVVSLFEAPIDGAMTTATALQPLRVDAHMGMREQLLIPATDAAALIGSLAELLAELEAWPELVAGRPQAQAWKLAGGFVAALPEGDAVRVLVSHGGSGLDPTADLARWQTQLDSVAVTPADTPALRHLGDGDAGLAMLLRPWRVRGAVSWEGLHYGRLALSDAPLDQREHAIARATELVLGGELMMPDEGAELDEWALTVTRSDGSPRVRAVASATELGKSVLAAARVDASAPLEITSGKLSIESWLALDRGMSAATGSPTAALGQLSATETIDMWRNCGAGCTIHAALRMPFGAAKSGVGGLLRAELAKLLDEELALKAAVFVRIAAVEPALTIDLVVGERSEATFNPSFPGVTWTFPRRPAEASPGDACIARAGLGVRRALAGWVTAEPDQRADMLIAGLTAIEDDLRCASEHPPTAAAAAGLRRMLLEAAIEAELATLAFDRAQALLERGCADHADPQLCARMDRFASAPKPTLASSADVEACVAAIDSYDEWPQGVVRGLPLYVTAEGLALGDRTLTPDKQAIAQAIVERSTGELGPLALVVDRDAELRTLLPVFEAFGALELSGFALATRDEQGRIYNVPVYFRGTKTFEIDRPESTPGPEDEPPLEDEPPPKSGLYAMKGPKDAVPQMERSRRSDETTLELDEISATTRWSSVVALATSVCPLSVTLDYSAE
jgi:hypothetical protein